MIVPNFSQRLVELGIELPASNPPLANYAPALRDGNLLWLSGHISRRSGQVVTGRVGDNVTVKAATELARQVAIDILSTIHSVVGINSVEQVVRIGGFICCTPDFDQQSAVLNGASDLLVEIFGADRGRHARSALGVTALPAGAAVEIEAVVRVASL